ncbi:MAG: MBL fold metallo-hydrolase [Clostridiales bacterium]|nr:MBL fold metallo-hydrolase [Clostridiales bacterium]
MNSPVELYLLTPEKDVLMMSIVIRTKNNKIIVIDGGNCRSMHCYYLHSAIRAILGLNENDYFEIEGWFLTHPHEDHFGEMILQFERFSKESNYKVNNIYFDFTDFSKNRYKDWTDESDKFIDRLKTALKNYDDVVLGNGKFLYENLNGALINPDSVESGLTITVDGVDFEILHTREDEKDVSVNGSSLVIKITADGQSVMILGDLDDVSGELFLEKCPPEKIKADIVQMAHHGNWAVDKSVYDAIDAKVRLWPTPLWVWNKDNPTFDNDRVREWVGATTVNPKFDKVSCLYKKYPENVRSVSDWKRVLSEMKISLPYTP